jgi:hypothetical protein
MKRRTAIVGPLVTLLAAPRARAETSVDVALVLAVDVSRSIDEAELQRRGYIEALTSRPVIDAILSGENRRIALCYVEWAGTAYQVPVIDWTLIDSEAAARRFAEKLAETPRTSQSWTAVGAALAFAGRQLAASLPPPASSRSGRSSTFPATGAPTTGHPPKPCATSWWRAASSSTACR